MWLQRGGGSIWPAGSGRQQSTGETSSRNVPASGACTAQQQWCTTHTGKPVCDGQLHR
eukprot:m.1487280 g.1487280  ORF g.1487280 m.1487280 type:complete len:58 (-) comp25185_c1_seq12:1048-1221(-)